jgi:hypothetical protein
MRGKDEQQWDVFSYVSPEQRVPQDLSLDKILNSQEINNLQNILSP